MDMEMQCPSDARDLRARSRRNIGDLERWGSIVSGSALTLYGLSRRRPSGLFLAAVGALLVRRGASAHCEIYQAFDLDTASSSGDTRKALRGAGGSQVEEAVTVNRAAADLYQFWRDLENLPRFMRHLDSVTRISDTQSRWRARGPRGGPIEWTAEIINEIPNELIAWKSLDGSDVVSAGSVHFDDAGVGRGTRIRVRLQYSPPGGKVGTALARLLGRDAASEIREDLRRLKQLVEAGEVATTNGQSRGQ
jgi:uncharacterized membrane protein